MKKIKYYIVLLTTILSTSSCEDQILGLEPLDAASDVTFFSNEKEIQLALNAAYGSLSFAQPEGVMLGQYMDAILTDNSIYRITDEYSGLQALSNSDHTGDTNFGSIYSSLYKSIGRTNNILQNMHRAEESTSASTLNDMRAQALTMRAYLYDYFVLMYGDVPFMTTQPNKFEDAFVARTPKADIYAAILSDLDEAATLIRTDLKGAQERITQATVYGIKARIALNAGMNDLAASAAELSLQAAATQGATLHENYQELFTIAGETSSEILLRKPCDETWKVSNSYPLRMGPRYGNYCQLLPTQNMIDAYPTANGLPIDKDPTYDPKNPWANRDPRMRASIVFPGDLWAGRIYESHRDSLLTTKVDGTRETNNNCRSRSWPAGLTGFLWKKYVDSTQVNNQITTAYNDMILFRLSEVYLIKAEALIEMGSDLQGAADALNALRARAWGGEEYPVISASSQSEMRKILRMERRVELANEGFRYFDLLRWKAIEKARKEPLVGRVLDIKNATHIPTIDEDGIVFYSDKSEYDDWRAMRVNYKIENGVITDLGTLNETGNDSYLNNNWANAHKRNFTSPRDYLFPIPLRERDLYKSYGYTLTQNPHY